MRKQSLINVLFLSIILTAGSAFAECPSPYPPLSAATTNYTFIPNPTSEFPRWDENSMAWAWDYKIINGNLSKIAHISIGISYDCTKDPIEMPDEDKYFLPCEGDTSSGWGEGFCNIRVYTITPDTAGQFTIYTNKKSVGVIQIAVDTGKGGTEGGKGPLIGPGYDIPEIILYNEVEELVFGSVKFCLKRTSPYDKCPSEVYAKDDLNLSCKEIIADQNNLLPDDALSDEVTGFGEGAVFCGQQNQECPTCLFQFGTGTTRCVSIGGRLRCY